MTLPLKKVMSRWRVPNQLINQIYDYFPIPPHERALMFGFFKFHETYVRFQEYRRQNFVINILTKLLLFFYQRATPQRNYFFSNKLLLFFQQRRGRSSIFFQQRATPRQSYFFSNKLLLFFQQRATLRAKLHLFCSNVAAKLLLFSSNVALKMFLATWQALCVLFLFLESEGEKLCFSHKLSTSFTSYKFTSCY